MQMVSIVIPARNESETLGKLLTDINKVIAQLPDYQFEVICVDDHSKDNTASVAKQHGATVLANKYSGGKGMALRCGFEAARGDIIMMMDADYSHRPEDIPLFLEALKNNDVGLVIGSRIIGGSEEYTPVRAFGNVFFTMLIGLLMKRYLSDALNGYKAFKRDVFTSFKYTSKNFEIEVELIANTLRKGYRIVEVSSHERARAGGRAKSRVIQHGFGFLSRIIIEWMKGIK
jgi:glycosyltransferase involved in cell wall biosynthesis